MGQFGLGQPVRRTEDPRLLTGQGRYAADQSMAGQVHALFLRSPHASARIDAIRSREAEKIPGVLRIVTSADVTAAGLGDIPCAIPVKDRTGKRLPQPGRPLLVRDRVRFVGDPVAMVVAETVAAARDALDLIEVDYEPLPAVATLADGIAEGAPAVWEALPDNRAFYWQRGDEKAVAAAFAGAHRVVTLEVVNNRVVPCAMEPRAVLGHYDQSTGRYTLFTSSQGAHAIKEILARHTLKVPADRIRVVVQDVGGGFGMKVFHYPEEALALWTSRLIGRPVKWVGDRSEAFIADTHGRDQQNRIAGAFDRDGRLLALKIHTFANMGAYLNQFAPAIPSQMTGCMLSGVYAVPALFAECEGIYTNTVPVDAYRGAGRPEATYLLERFMDRAARELGLPRDEIRRRNFIPPAAMPYTTASGPTYDSGDFAAVMDRAKARAEWDDFEGRRAEARARGILRGIGMSTYVEICGFDGEDAHIRFRSDGSVEVLIGTQSTGQGHETAYAQIAADGLGLPLGAVRVVQGDTDRIATGKGTSGSRSLPVGGPAVKAAVNAVIARGKVFAAHLLQADPESIQFNDGVFSVPDSPQAITLADLAAAARQPENLPPGEDKLGLDGSGSYTIEGSTFPNGCHIAEVEVMGKQAG